MTSTTMNGPLTPPSSNEELAPQLTPPSPLATSEEPTAPPTPPASSQAPPPQAAAASEPEQQQSPYFDRFAQITEVEATGDYVQLARVAERADLDATHDNHPTRLLVITPLILSYLIVDDLPPAKSALLRLPHNIAAQALPQALFNLLASTWDRRYENVYVRAEAILKLVQESDASADAAVTSLLARLVNTFINSFRKRTSALVSKAYTSIPLSLAQTYLGLDREQLLAAAQADGWQYDAATEVLTPAKPAFSGINKSLSAPSTLATFNLVTDSVARLEA